MLNLSAAPLLPDYKKSEPDREADVAEATSKMSDHLSFLKGLNLLFPFASLECSDYFLPTSACSEKPVCCPCFFRRFHIQAQLYSPSQEQSELEPGSVILDGEALGVAVSHIDLMPSAKCGKFEGGIKSTREGNCNFCRSNQPR